MKPVLDFEGGYDGEPAAEGGTHQHQRTLRQLLRHLHQYNSETHN